MGRSARYQTSSVFIAPRSFRGWVGDGGHDGGYPPRSDKLRSTGMLHRNRKHTQTMDEPRLGWKRDKAKVEANPTHGHTNKNRKIDRKHNSAQPNNDELDST